MPNILKLWPIYGVRIFFALQFAAETSRDAAQLARRDLLRDWEAGAARNCKRQKVGLFSAKGARRGPSHVTHVTA